MVRKSCVETPIQKERIYKARLLDRGEGNPIIELSRLRRVMEGSHIVVRMLSRWRMSTTRTVKNRHDSKSDIAEILCRCNK